MIEEANQWLGCGMTYTLFEGLKDRLEELTADQPLEPVKAQPAEETEESRSNEVKSTTAPKKEQLTKAQKRRQWERTDHDGNRPRGFDWIDLVRYRWHVMGGETTHSYAFSYSF